MKTAALFLSGLLLSALASGPASAEPVRVRLTARVTQVDDPGSALAGRIVVGQRVNGLYVYNTNTPNQAPDPDIFGDYRPYANEARVRFAAGGLVFESKQPTQGIQIFVNPQSQFSISSVDNKDLADGSTVYSIWMAIGGGTGNVTESSALPNVAPILQDYWTREVVINGNAAAGGEYMLRAYIEAAELIEADAIVVSPASGTFVANQGFDAAVILPRNRTVANAQAIANGAPLFSLSYPGACQLQPQVGTGKPSLLCPAAESALPVAAGQPITWTVEFTDGTMLTKTVNWQLAP